MGGCELQSVQVCREGVHGVLSLELSTDGKASKKRGNSLCHSVQSAIVTTSACPFPLTPPSFENLCGKFTNAKWKQSLKLVSNPSVSVGKLMDERQWEGPTSHQAAVVRDRLARDVYAVSEVEAADRARLASLQQMAPATAASLTASPSTPVAQLPPRPGCYLAVRLLDAGAAAGPSGAGVAAGLGRSPSGNLPLPMLSVVQLLDYRPSGGMSTVVTLDKQQAAVVDMSMPPGQGVAPGCGLMAVPGAPYYVLSPPYEQRFTPGGGPGGSMARASAGGALAASAAMDMAPQQVLSPMLPEASPPPMTPVAPAAAAAAAEAQAAEEIEAAEEVDVLAPLGVAPRSTRARVAANRSLPVKTEPGAPAPSPMVQGWQLHPGQQGQLSPLQELQHCLANGMIPIGNATDAHGPSRPATPGTSKLKRLASVAADFMDDPVAQQGRNTPDIQSAAPAAAPIAIPGQAGTTAAADNGPSPMLLGTPPEPYDIDQFFNPSKRHQPGPAEGEGQGGVDTQAQEEGAASAGGQQPAGSSTGDAPPPPGTDLAGSANNAQGLGSAAADTAQGAPPPAAFNALAPLQPLHNGAGANTSLPPIPSLMLPSLQGGGSSLDAHLQAVQSMAGFGAGASNTHDLLAATIGIVSGQRLSTGAGTALDRLGSGPLDGALAPQNITSPSPVRALQDAQRAAIAGTAGPSGAGGQDTSALALSAAAVQRQVCVEELARLLVTHQARITELEQQIRDRDRRIASLECAGPIAAAAGGPAAAAAAAPALAPVQGPQDTCSPCATTHQGSGDHGQRVPTPAQMSEPRGDAAGSAQQPAAGATGGETEAEAVAEGGDNSGNNATAADGDPQHGSEHNNGGGALAALGASLQGPLAALTQRCLALEADCSDLQQELGVQRTLAAQLAGLNMQLMARCERLKREREELAALLASSMGAGPVDVLPPAAMPPPQLPLVV